MTVIQFDHTPLEKARDDKAILTALIGDLAGQGHRVTVLGMPAYLPEWMEVPGQPVSPGDEVEVRVIKVPPESKNVIVSAKAVFEKRNRDKAERHVPGDIVHVRVMRLEVFGALVRMEGGFVGLVPVKELCHATIHSPEQAVAVGDEFDAEILRVRQSKGKTLIELSRKRLLPSPLNDTTLEVGDVVEAEVANIKDYGAFVNIGDVPALLHRSELSWSEKEPDPRSLLKVGDRIKVKVVILDRETKKMAVSLREMLPNPWDDLALAPGYSFTGTVIKKLGFGVLVALPEGMYGLLHSTELTESRKGRNSALKAIKIGDSLPVVVKSIDRESRKIDLELQKTDETKES